MTLITPSVAARESRAIPLQTGDPMTSFGTARRCGATDCSALLSRYNPATTCSLHHGWREGPQPRRRR